MPPQKRFRFFPQWLQSHPAARSLAPLDPAQPGPNAKGKDIPGTLSIEADASPPTIVLIDYDPNRATRHVLQTPEECLPFLATESVSWVDVQGLGSEEILRRLGQVFKLHPLMLEDIVLEDIVNVPQRPKIEDYQGQLLIISRMVLPKAQPIAWWLVTSCPTHPVI